MDQPLLGTKRVTKRGDRMIIDVSQNGMNIIFEITEDNKVVLKEFSNASYCRETEKELKWCPIVEIQATGENQNDHHGAKHTGTWGGLSLTYNTHKCYENEFGNKLEFFLHNEKIEVVVHYQFYAGISAVRAWTDVTNICEECVGLEYVSSFSYTGLENNEPLIYIPHNTWCREVDWKTYTLNDLGLGRTRRFATKRITESNTGTWSSKEHLPMGAFVDRQNTLMWQIESSGSWQWEISDIADMLYLKLSGPTEQENGWFKALETGETFSSTKVGIVIGNDFDHALEQMTKYRRYLFANNLPNSKMPVIFNDYMNCLRANPTTEKLLPIIDKAAEAGAEYFCMDAGWYADGTWWDMVGEWQPCAWRFPGGIKEVFDYIRERGMIPGIWLEIEVMGIVCPILEQFDDSCFFMRHGKKIIDHSRYQLDFRSEKVQEFATSIVKRVVEEYGVGYIKMDYNIEAGIGTEVKSDSFGDGALQCNRAYLEWIDKIKAMYPDLILENCASGGMRMDYAMLSKFHLQSVSDETSYKNTAVIASNATTAVLPEQAAIWSYPLACEDKNEASFNMINSMLTRMHLSGEIWNLSPKQFEDVKQGVECYKSFRTKIPEFIPFYPLGLNSYQDDFVCVGYKTETEKYLAVWRMNSEDDSVFIPLHNLDTVSVLYPSDSKCKIDATETGLSICLPDKYSAVILKSTCLLKNKNINERACL